MNLHGRIEGVDSNKAGNYSVLVPLASADVVTPSLIRKVYHNGPLAFSAQRAVTHTTLPSNLSLFNINMKISAQSNWTSLYKKVEHEGCRQTLHLPMMDLLGPSPFSGCLVFRATDDRLGILLVTSKHKSLTNIAKHEAFGAPFLRRKLCESNN